jgi:hypothetical protein
MAGESVQNGPSHILRASRSDRGYNGVLIQRLGMHLKLNHAGCSKIRLTAP